MLFRAMLTTLTSWSMLMLFTSAEGTEMNQQVITDRAGDRDRAKTAARLGQALAQGSLELGEYEQRVQTAFQTHTSGELRELLADLPLDRIRRADTSRRAARPAAARPRAR